MRFAGKVVIVTGGAAGIGAATAQRLADEGAIVVVADIDSEKGEQTAASLANKGARPSAFRLLDVSEEEKVAQFARDVAAEYGRIDVLINNTGVGTFGTTPELSSEAWHRTINVTMNSVFYCSKAVIPLMSAAGGGSIVNVASICGLGGDYGLAAYSTAKGGIIAYTRTMALDHIREGIRINCICPGIVDTPGASPLKSMPKFWEDVLHAYPRGSVLQPAEIAASIAFLASDDASGMIGAAMVVDGGMSAWTGQPNLTAAIAEMS